MVLDRIEIYTNSLRLVKNLDKNLKFDNNGKYKLTKGFWKYEIHDITQRVKYNYAFKFRINIFYNHKRNKFSSSVNFCYEMIGKKHIYNLDYHTMWNLAFEIKNKLISCSNKDKLYINQPEKDILFQHKEFIRFNGSYYSDELSNNLVDYIKNLFNNYPEECVVFILKDDDNKDFIISYNGISRKIDNEIISKIIKVNKSYIIRLDEKTNKIDTTDKIKLSLLKYLKIYVENIFQRPNNLPNIIESVKPTNLL